MSKSVLGPLKRTPGSTEALCLSPEMGFPTDVHSQNCGVSSSQHKCSKLGSRMWGWGPLPLRGHLCSQDLSPNSSLPQMRVGPARLTSLPHLPSLLGSFFMSLVIGVLFSYFSGGPQGWLFYNLVVIFMWSWEMASIAFTYFVILTRSFICLFYYNRPSGYKVVSHYGLNLHFSDDKWYGASFHMFINYLYMFFEEMSVHVLCPFWGWVVYIFVAAL